MEHIAALLLIVGCSADLAECRELPAPVPVFETAEECDAELPRASLGYDGAYPHVVARCIAVDPAMEEADAELVWDVRSDGSLVASIETAGVMVATNSPRTDKRDRFRE
ncbi:MAG: hypothetical protein F9K19_17705 [Rhizobiaceae bacterium]|nr:MAG: hypothetical protein F9K19_17705 [Rhizobiaceae bacterium]CAG1013534.1 hypothetical protein RHIZO_04531 [Rhizobiaceae bacterium]